MWWYILSPVNKWEWCIFSEWHRHTRKKEIRVLLSGVERPSNYTSSDALSLSYRKLPFCSSYFPSPILIEGPGIYYSPSSVQSILVHGYLWQWSSDLWCNKNSCNERKEINVEIIANQCWCNLDYYWAFKPVRWGSSEYNQTSVLQNHKLD